MSQQHLLLDFCPQPLQNRAMGRPIIQVESHNMRTDRITKALDSSTKGQGECSSNTRHCTICTWVPDTRVFTWYPIPGYFAWVPGYQETSMVWGFFRNYFWGKLYQK